MSVQGDTIISIKHVSKSFSGKKVLEDINIDIRKGEFVTFLGPSGCGKTTMLRMIAGFCPPDSGDIFINGKDMKDVPPYERQLNTVFQRYALFPHLDVYDNVAFGLKLNKVPEAEINKRVKRILKMVSMSDYEDRSVDTLSGGQQQRIAIARALVNQPDVLLLDEPLAALDLKMRKDMQIELKEMHKKLGITFIYVTHDQEEALTLSDTIVVMNDGRIQQTGAPIDIYNEPVNSFVADFIGESNILNGVMLKDKVVSFIGQEFKCVDEGFGENTPVDIVVRPEDVQLRSNVDKTQFYGTITSCTFKGVYYQLFIQTDSGFEMMAQDFRPFEPGTRTGLSISPENIQVMHKERLLNEFEGEVVSPGVVSFLGADFECETGEFEAGTKVLAKVDFSKIDIMDDIEQGNVSGALKFIIYKGDHYHVTIATENGENVYADTNDVWDKNDLVGIRIAKEDIVISKAW